MIEKVEDLDTSSEEDAEEGAEEQNQENDD
jgi:hypothetical protein